MTAVRRTYGALAGAVAVVLLLLVWPSIARAQFLQGDLQAVKSFENACSQTMIDDGTDARCRKGLAIALGKEPGLQEVRLPNGTVTQTSKLMPPDVPKSGWLGEEACANRHWRSCMLYVLLLERGDVVPADRAHAQALMQRACDDGHFRACQRLKDDGIAQLLNPPRPPRPSWVKAPAAEPLPRATVAVPPPLAPPSERSSAQPAAPIVLDELDERRTRALAAVGVAGVAVVGILTMLAVFIFQRPLRRDLRQFRRRRFVVRSPSGVPRRDASDEKKAPRSTRVRE
jgi:hypothetical protein